MLASVLAASAAIFHGAPTTATEIPWFASLTELGSPICGGSLIAPDRVVTAAHCVQGSRPGDFQVTIAGSARQVRGVYFPTSYRIIPSPVKPDDYYASASIDDIAVIALKTPVTGVAPVALANPAPADHEATTTVGRGSTNARGDQPADPRRADQQVLPAADCRRLYQQLLHASRHLCTKDPTPTDAQACPGDSGSAVLVHRNGTLQLAGVVIWGG
jgi:V8-like Glu-specific endopeptidase